jgi:hypothetical protein
LARRKTWLATVLALLLTIGFLQFGTHGGGIVRPQTNLGALPSGSSSPYPAGVNNSLVSGVVNSSSCTSACFSLGAVPYNSSSQAADLGMGRVAGMHGSAGLGPASYAGHYWIGADYSGSSTTSTNIYTTITTPSSGPHVSEDYYELLSAWDDNGQYDQLGISSVYYTGSCPVGGGCTTSPYWEVLWSQENTGCGAFTWNSAAYNLGQWTNYTFQMQLSGSNLVFNVYYGIGTGGTLLFTHSRSDTASHFVIAPSYTSCGTSYADFTNYEEVYQISNTMQFPQWDWQFDATYSGSTLITSWSNLNAGPPTNTWGYYEAYPNAQGSVQIANEPFEIQFPTDYFSIAPGGGVSWQSGSIARVGSYCSYGFSQCAFSMTCNVPSGFQSVGYGYPTYVPGAAGWDILSYSSTPAGQYYPGCTGSIPAGSAYSTYIFYVTVT